MTITWRLLPFPLKYLKFEWCDKINKNTIHDESIVYPQHDLKQKTCPNTRQFDLNLKPKKKLMLGHWSPSPIYRFRIHCLIVDLCTFCVDVINATNEQLRNQKNHQSLKIVAEPFQ